MANKLKAADLIGKEFIIGNGVATYSVDSVKGDFCSLTFRREGFEPLTVPVKTERLLAFAEDGLISLREAGRK